MEKMYLQNEAAKILNISRYTLAKYEKEGKIPKAKRMINKYRYYTYDDIKKIAKIIYGTDDFLK